MFQPGYFERVFFKHHGGAMLSDEYEEAMDAPDCYKQEESKDGTDKSWWSKARR